MKKVWHFAPGIFGLGLNDGLQTCLYIFSIPCQKLSTSRYETCVPLAGFTVLYSRFLGAVYLSGGIFEREKIVLFRIPISIFHFLLIFVRLLCRFHFMYTVLPLGGLYLQ